MNDLINLKKNLIWVILLPLCGLVGCKSFDQLLPNPNVAGEDKAVPASLILPRVEFDIYDRGDGGPFTQGHIWNQFSVSNNLYYGGNNSYNWTNTGNLYSVLKNVNQMDAQAAKALGTTTSGCAA